jgi:hypoxanthine-guanine phosphoribosyltransferase
MEQECRPDRGVSLRVLYPRERIEAEISRLAGEISAAYEGMGLLQQRGAKSLSVCTLIDKLCRREADVTPDYVGISCTGGFLVGYGLDLDERMRELSAIYEIIENPIGGVE